MANGTRRVPSKTITASRGDAPPEGQWGERRTAESAAAVRNSVTQSWFPASQSWSPARLAGARGPAGSLECHVRKDLALNLSGVYENIRGRASKAI